MPSRFPTPFEQGNRNQTSTWEQCIAFYQALAAAFPQRLRFFELGETESGLPLHAGVVSADGEFDPALIRRAGRTVFFNNNGIHPGEPEGIDACMALVRDLCCLPQRLAELGTAAYLFIPVYNVEGCLDRHDRSRVNQDGPEQFGFRGNSRHLDLNRDFIKCDSHNARLFNQFFTHWDPDVMVDTHTSNGADYPYTMTLIHTQADKLGSGLGPFLRQTMLPQIYAQMEARGWPTCPYVDSIGESPEQGIVEFLETPRFSTGYAALHHCIGFMPETHMLKPFADRYAAMRALLDVVLAFTVEHGQQIRRLRQEARQAALRKTHWPVQWQMDAAPPKQIRFKGYAACHHPSLLGNYSRLSYDRSQPWEREIAYHERFVEQHVVRAPRAYVVPQAWGEVLTRLRWNGVEMERLAAARSLTAQYYLITGHAFREQPYEGHQFIDALALETRSGEFELRAGDYWIPLAQENARYAVETLEPLAHDSFFRWGFFNSVLEKKERYSDYVFEDLALQLLKEEPVLQSQFEQWKSAHPELLASQEAVLDFIFTHCRRYAEPAWRRYPVLSIL